VGTRRHRQASHLDISWRFCLNVARFSDNGTLNEQPNDFRKGLSLAARVGVELVAALIVGGGLGYLADWYFGTNPWLTVIGLFLGMSAGLLNIYRMASRL
jgi:F0F1-type ATP synthase assembly protein I